MMSALIRRFALRRVLGLAVVAFATLAVACHASAVDVPPREAVYDQATLEAFATAAADVIIIRGQYAPRIKAAPSEEAAGALIAEARTEMHEAVTRAGLSVELYSTIADAARHDDELFERIQALIR
jgi:hypothetical protein